MAALITGDIHFSADPRNAYRFLFVDWLCDAIKKYDVKDLIILGDITDVKDEHGAEFVNEVVEHLHRLSKLCFITVLTGNHDYVSDLCPFFRFVGYIPNIAWIDKITNMHIDDIGDCLFLPHTKDWKKEWTVPLKKERDCVFTHCTFEGATGGFGRKLSGVPLDMFKKQSLVVSGDIHVPQRLGNVLYAGAPYTINFGNDYQGRVLLLDAGQCTPIDVDIPQKWLLVINGLNDLKRQKQPQLMKGDILRIEYELRRRDQEHWYEIKAEIQAWGRASGYDIDAVVPLIDIQTTPYKKVDIETDQELITEYAKSIGASSKTLQRGLYLSERAAA
jgi:hypothetical protein